MEFPDNTITIDNAPWWAPHSHVVLRGLFLAEDEAAINNQAQTLSFNREGASNGTLTNQAGSATILKVQRMVQQGTVSVLLHGGRKHDIALPSQASRLSTTDLNYINEQIDLVSRPMTAEEQMRFLASQNGRSEAHLSPVK